MRTRDDGPRLARIAFVGDPKTWGIVDVRETIRAERPVTSAREVNLPDATGTTTTPSSGMPPSVMPIMTANSPFLLANSRVPSTGSTKKTRSFAKLAQELVCVRHALLGDDAAPGKRRAKAGDDDVVRLAIGARHRIFGAFQIDGEVGRVDLHHPHRCFFGERENGTHVAIERAHPPPTPRSASAPVSFVMIADVRYGGMRPASRTS